MSPSLALAVWLIFLAGLLYLDPARIVGTSPALWVPVIWMFIVGTRLPSQWLGGKVVSAARAFEEGNSLDRTIFCIFILLATGILMSRSFKWSDFFGRNLALTAFLLFALLSVLWSDFPFVSFKRWFRDLGNYLVVLVVLSDPDPVEAVRTVLRRLCYILISLSVLLIKYYPDIGIQYNYWTGGAMYVGPTTGKNLLGVVCLVSGLFFFWDIIVRWPDHNEWRTKRVILIDLAFIAMTLWLLHRANSATSRVCLILGCLVIAAAHTKVLQRRPKYLKALIPSCLLLYPILAFGFNMNAELAGAVGRDPTFTERTAIWDILPAMQPNLLLGAGYESFWLGNRLKVIWQSSVGSINEAHNGYLEVYLNLGIVGVLLLGAFLIASYRTICKRLTPFTSFASLTLALWSVMLLYNVTEAAFKWHPMWFMFLLAALAVPGYSDDHVHDLEVFSGSSDTEEFLEFPLETAGTSR
jgi:exopolysaccharide production protein ExoQ